jgi:hypothetical protein
LTIGTVVSLVNFVCVVATEIYMSTSTTNFNIGMFPVLDGLTEHIVIDVFLSNFTSYKVGHSS